ncbi:DUF2927 domain-containing protein [Pseudotabrizicola algicola]|uniref:DUF2927 domain-containing protein n=1 Tax=Pseudotabrizicola algicola TaxID=2709381 RepID=A0A6B3RHU6_9RHOB|nr:DUF2927 domain-containing protein [Pseudotabrizicola algicola]
MTRHRWLAACLSLMAAPSLASDGVKVDGLLPDADFFRAATCGAAPGEPCRQEPLLWPKTALTLAVLPSDVETGRFIPLLLSVSVDYALLQMNRAGSGLTITRVDGPEADIRLRLTDAAEGSLMPDVPGFSAPGEMGVGYATVWSTPDNRITEASILISAQISPADIVSVVLEEIYQSTGPLFDIDSPAYEGVSILSQNANSTVTIAGQDAALLRHLYPPEP